jgi:hypothetical protein
MSNIGAVARSKIERSMKEAALLLETTSVIDANLLVYLLSAAVKFSGLPAIPVAQLPSIRLVSAEYISSKVCPDDKNGCTGLVAVFDTDDYVILVRDSLDLETTFDNSFLLHELVHVLQFKSRGAAIFRNCLTAIRTESEAYKAQNAYLQHEGQFARFGEGLRFATCEGQQDALSLRELMVEPSPGSSEKTETKAN